DAEGRVVGVNAMVAGPRVALAIPSHVVEEFLGGRASGAWLGIVGVGVELPPALAAGQPAEPGSRIGGAGAGAPPPGGPAGPGSRIGGRGAVALAEVIEGGPAAAGGLIVGDVLLSLDGAEVADPGRLRSELARRRPGQAIRARVLRGGGPLELTLIAGAP